jgi:hypothetical protein
VLQLERDVAVGAAGGPVRPVGYPDDVAGHGEGQRGLEVAEGALPRAAVGVRRGDVGVHVVRVREKCPLLQPFGQCPRDARDLRDAGDAAGAGGATPYAARPF